MGEGIDDEFDDDNDCGDFEFAEWSLQRSVIQEHMDEGLLDEAVGEATALVTSSRSFTQPDERLPQSLELLADVYALTRDCRSQVSVKRMAVQEWGNCLGNSHPAVVATWRELAEVQFACEEVGDAEQSLLTAVKLYQEGPNHIPVIRSTNDKLVAALLDDHGITGPFHRMDKHAATGEVFTRLAQLCHKQKRHADSEEYCRRAIASFKLSDTSIPGDVHPRMLLAGLFCSRKDFDGAEAILRGAVGAFCKPSRGRSSWLPRILARIAYVKEEQSYFDEAGVLYIRAMRMAGRNPDGGDGFAEIATKYRDFLERTGQEDQIGLLDKYVAQFGFKATDPETPE